MEVRKDDLPKHVERCVAVTLTQDELRSILTSALRTKLQTHPLRLEDIQVSANADGTLKTLEVNGVEIIHLSWGKTEAAKEPAAQANTPTQSLMAEAA